jgi:hypothetical protein
VSQLASNTSVLWLFDTQCGPQKATVSVRATDATSVASVRLHYAPPGTSTFTSIPMTKGTGATWSAVLPIDNGWAGGLLQYHVIARDAAGNASRLPTSGEQTITVQFCIIIT